MRIAKFHFLVALIFSLLTANASAEDSNMNFKDDIQIGDLCKNDAIKIFVPSKELDAPQVKKEDDHACQWTFASVNKDNFVWSNFGVFLIKEALKESDRQRFAEFIIKQYLPTDDVYINFEGMSSDGAFNDYKFEIGLKNEDESRVSIYNALFSDSKLGTLLIFSTIPKIFGKKGTVTLNNGKEFYVYEEQKKIYDYVNFWRENNANFLSQQISNDR